MRCNWVQIVEGFLDSSHISHLHASNPSDPEYKKMKMADGAPTFDVEITPYGLNAAAIRNIGDGRRYTRVTELVMPGAGFIPATRVPGPAYDAYPEVVILSVPVDDVTTVQWWIRYTRRAEDAGNLFGGGWVQRSEADDDVGPGSRQGGGRSRDRPRVVADGRHRDGREPGRIADRSREYLGSSDSVIARYRRQLIEQIRTHAAGNVPSSLAGDLPYE